MMDKNAYVLIWKTEPDLHLKFSVELNEKFNWNYDYFA